MVKESVNSSSEMVKSGVRCGLLFMAFGLVGLPIAPFVYGVSVGDATTFMAVPLILLYILWRTMRAFASPATTETSEAPKGVRMHSPLLTVITLLAFMFFLMLFLTILCGASYLAYWALRMEWATIAIRSLAVVFLRSAVVIGFVIAFILLLRHYSWLIVEATLVFVSLPLKMRNRLGDKTFHHGFHRAV